MNFIQDHRLEPRQSPEAVFGGEHEIETLRGSDEDIRRVAYEPAPLGLLGVAASKADTNFREGCSGLGEAASELVERPVKVALDIVVECL